MTSIISELAKTIRFYDLFDNVEYIFCDVTINVKLLLYSNTNKYYDITYSYKYSNGSSLDIPIENLSDKENRTNPFYYKQNSLSNDSYNGVIVAQNSLTDKMIEYLLMDSDELENYIGSTWYVQYKANIMYMLSFMWD